MTCDDFRIAMMESSNIDLRQFELWYSQAGTPTVAAFGSYDTKLKTYTLNFKQTCFDVGDEVGQANTKKPFFIPLNIGLIATCDTKDIVKGQDLLLCLRSNNTTSYSETHTEITLHLKHKEQTFVFENICCEPLPSLNRKFSAPIILEYAYTEEELLFLLTFDTDTFNRWNAAQNLWLKLILQQYEKPNKILFSKILLNGFKNMLENHHLIPGFCAKVFNFPDFNEAAYFFKLNQLPKYAGADPNKLYDAIEEVQDQLATRLQQNWQEIYTLYDQSIGAAYNAKNAGMRALKNLSLVFITRANWTQNQLDATALAHIQYQKSTNMTDRLAAFELIIEEDTLAANIVIQDYYNQFASEPLVIDKWFSSLATRTCFSSQKTLKMIKSLAKHPAYEKPTPNRVEALIFSFCENNPVHFHQKNGSGYQFWAVQVIALDKTDPQMAASLARCVEHWRSYADPNRTAIEVLIKAINNQANLSSELSEVLSRLLK